MWTFPCPNETCAPSADRPYAYKRDGVPSATGLVGVLDKGEGMTHAAAGETATYWLNNAHDLLALPYEEAYDKSRRVFKGLWDKSALLGSLAHNAAQTWADGQDWEIPTEWRGKPLELEPPDIARLYTYVEGLAHWWEKRNPTVLAAELVVARSDPAYRGSLDQLIEVDLPGIGTVVAVGDFKTSAKVGHEPYARDWELQLLLYGLCDRVQHWHERQLIAEIPWPDDLPRPTHGVLVNIQGDGSVREYVCEIRDSELDTLRALTLLKSWKPTLQQTAIMNEPELLVAAYDPDEAARQAAVMLG